LDFEIFLIVLLLSEYSNWILEAFLLAWRCFIAFKMFKLQVGSTFTVFNLCIVAFISSKCTLEALLLSWSCFIKRLFIVL